MKKNPQQNLKTNLKKFLAVLALFLLAAVMAFVYVRFGAKPVSGSKAITISVVNSQNQETVYSLRTDAQFLLGAMAETEGLSFSGSEGPYGMMITEVNGETADYNINGAYWGFSVNGEYCNYGISEQPVHDGDAFVIAYTK